MSIKLETKTVMGAWGSSLGGGLLAAFRDEPNEDNLNAILEAGEANLRALMKGGKRRAASPARDDVKVAAKKTTAKAKAKADEKPARKAKVAAKAAKPAAKKTTAKAKAKPAAKTTSGDFAPGDRVRCDGDKGTIRRLRGAQAYVDFDNGDTDKIPLADLKRITKKAK